MIQSGVMVDSNCGPRFVGPGRRRMMVHPLEVQRKPLRYFTDPPAYSAAAADDDGLEAERELMDLPPAAVQSLSHHSFTAFPHDRRQQMLHHELHHQQRSPQSKSRRKPKCKRGLEFTFGRSGDRRTKGLAWSLVGVTTLLLLLHLFRVIMLVSDNYRDWKRFYGANHVCLRHRNGSNLCGRWEGYPELHGIHVAAEVILVLLLGAALGVAFLKLVGLFFFFSVSSLAITTCILMLVAIHALKLNVFVRNKRENYGDWKFPLDDLPSSYNTQFNLVIVFIVIDVVSCFALVILGTLYYRTVRYLERHSPKHAHDHDHDHDPEDEDEEEDVSASKSKSKSKRKPKPKKPRSKLKPSSILMEHFEPFPSPKSSPANIPWSR